MRRNVTAVGDQRPATVFGNNRHPVGGLRILVGTPMRGAALILLALTVVFAPVALAAGGVLCGSVPEAGSEPASCCCGPAQRTGCGCGCEHPDSSTPRGLSGCGCDQSQPQLPGAGAEKPFSGTPVHVQVQEAGDETRPVFEPTQGSRGEVRPPNSRPLLV